MRDSRLLVCSCVELGPVSGGFQPGCWRDLHGAAECRIWEKVFPGRREEVRRARFWTRNVVQGAPFADDAEQIVTELINNAILHTASGWSLGCFSMAHAVSERVVTLSVTDEGRTGNTPQRKDSDGEAQNGRGLDIVTKLAHRTRVHRASGGYRIAADIIRRASDGLWSMQADG
ncbi:ATP-binding protein [Streptomyces jumonjinensis]|uniref:ATP-binding protein n=1 Tax=Streptomyces jumonjinensis TaxID=1945 RepID=UPI00378CB4D5